MISNFQRWVTQVLPTSKDHIKVLFYELIKFPDYIFNFRSLCYSELDVWLISVPTWVIGLQLLFFSQWWLTCWFYTTVSCLSEISKDRWFGIDWAIHYVFSPISNTENLRTTFSSLINGHTSLFVSSRNSTLFDKFYVLGTFKSNNVLITNPESTNFKNFSYFAKDHQIVFFFLLLNKQLYCRLLNCHFFVSIENKTRHKLFWKNNS